MSHVAKGRTRGATASPRSMHERDADTNAEMRSRTRTVVRGTGEGTSAARQTGTARGEPGGDEALTLIEQVVRRENLVAAHARVVRNGGAPGVDGMTVDDLMPYPIRRFSHHSLARSNSSAIVEAGRTNAIA